MREFTKSVLSLPWAISMFGVQQVANLVSPGSDRRVAGTAAAFDAVTKATEQQLDGWMKQTYTVGHGVQNGLVDLMTGQPPAVDSSALMRMAAEMQSGPLFQLLIKYGMPPVAWFDSFLVPRADSAAVLQEFSNKLDIIQLVTQVHGTLGLDHESHEPLPSLVERAANMETFPRLWAVEGLGNYYGDKALEEAAGGDPQMLLTDEATAALPPWSLTMLHAGIGMSFAKAILKTLDTTSTPDVVRAAVERFVSLCRNSSRPGYTGAALESLGLATRTLYPNLAALIDREIPSVDPELSGYFWHGVGRAMYFEPLNMLPSANAPWRAVTRLAQEVPAGLPYKNALAGISWAITVVNMRHPEVMSAFLRHHGDIAERDDAFRNGLTSSLLMRYDTTRDGTSISPFIHHEPVDPVAQAAWHRFITTPCDDALRTTYPQLKRSTTLEQLFHYRPEQA
ncbi:MAG: hypothetical protein WD227_16240 [Vicinamibacterales bacterium]